ncbi:ABC transporter permease [Chelatococcus sp. HY11]|uniref:ABC transporter permease n=2 Tax=unclassified Chelatococcus TaxID=2638111 RepID=UPI001BD19EEC|nr:ABC transporter permease [Chelatococcus sp. HY11]MBS7742363.1 ABC transporter permease [Chelatococcus sp. HY11]CAH1657066.1 ABC transporter permease subunit [Hyphomicrobiales bacterium]CAH1695954.1 ABC transporter permease subunit [Hyphomicrobiales bacterium]
MMSIDLKTAPAATILTDEKPGVASALASVGIRRRRTWPRLNRLTVSLAMLGAIILLGILAPALAPHDPDRVSMLARSAPPVWMEGGTWKHLLGTDQIGRDLLSRVMWGIRTSFGIAVFGLIFSAVLGIGLGVVSGVVGGWFDRFAMMLVDVFITLPNLLLILCGIALLGTDTWVLVVMIGLVRWEAYARLVRGQVLYLRELGYVEASRVLGGGPGWIILRHILPNLISPTLVMITLSFPGVLLMEAGLSFLGVGVQPPTASLGRMIGDGRDHLVNAWWIALVPSMVVVLITLAFQIAGDALRDRMDELHNG